jgi:3-deoxy-7-phosphoheptulonate synthase
LIEMHPRPDQALSDGEQSVTPEQLSRIIADCGQVATAVGRTL